MQQAFVIPHQGCNFAILFISGGKRRDSAGDPPAHESWDEVEQLHQPLHLWNHFEAVIPGKEFIATQSRKRDLDPGGSSLAGDKERVNAVDGGLIHRRQGRGYAIEHIALRNRQLLVLSRECLRYCAGIHRLVVIWFAEDQRESVGAAELAEQCHQTAGIDTSRQENTDGHVTHQVQTYRLLDQGAQFSSKTIAALAC